MIAPLTKPATTVDGTPACAAGAIKLVIKEYSSTNPSTKLLKKKTNCMVCIDAAATCDGLVANTY